MSSWQARRYSPWLLKHEELLRHKQTAATRSIVIAALAIAVAEAIWPWDSFAHAIPYLAHIAATAVALPVLYLAWQNDLRKKEQAFATALSDKGRRLLFLDPYLEPEEFALSERMSGAHVLPLQRQLDAALNLGPGASLHRRMEQYFRILPSAVHEGDRMGLLSVLHPMTFVVWVAVLVVVWVCLPGIGTGLTLLPLLGLVYLGGTRLNTRFGYELALYDWLRNG
ncbi:MAG: hypothetical protein M3R04_01960 [bacterium]|nr:hypothetical protein [bacterium]